MTEAWIGSLPSLTCVTKSLIPPSKWNSSLHSPSRSSVSLMRRLRVRNAVSRRRCRRVSRENSRSSKISESGRNEIVVPVSPEIPTASMSPVGSPRANSC